MPEVAFVEFPGKHQLSTGQQIGMRECLTSKETLLVEDNDVAASEVDGMRSTQAGHY